MSAERFAFVLLGVSLLPLRALRARNAKRSRPHSGPGLAVTTGDVVRGGMG